MKILVPGGNGFVGRNVVELLQDQTELSVIPLSIRDRFDLTDFELTKKYFSDIKPEIIINCSAEVGSLNYVTQKAADVFDNNMRMLLNLYKAVLETCPQAILINPVANCAYPGNLDFYSEDKFWDGKIHQSVLSYGSTRRMIIVLSECYKIQYNVKSINYFVPNMYGPYDSTDPNKAHALNALISKVVKAKHENKKEIEVWGTGRVIREWLYVKDFAEITLKTIKEPDSAKFEIPFNIGQNSGLSIKELVEIIVKESGFGGEVVWNTSMPDGAPKKVMDDKIFRKKFPAFEFTGFIEGIRETTKYYESIYPY